MTQDNANINCPNCGQSIDVNQILYNQIEENIKKNYAAQISEEKRKYDDELKKLDKDKAEFEEKKRQENELFQEKLQTKLKEEGIKIEQKIKAKLTEEQANRLTLLQAELNEKSKQVIELNDIKATLEKTKRDKDELESKIRTESEIKLTQKLNEEKEKIQKTIENNVALKIAEKENIISQLNNQLKEAQKKAEQGSMQLQGEVQELAIEEWLALQFPLDTIEEIKKGTKGGDCIQIVNTRSHQNCGSIYYESKRTKDFQLTWIEKFKTDMREKGVTFGVIVTEAMPKDMTHLGQKDGVWICTLEEFKGLCFVLRESVILLANALKTQENKGDKMNMLYSYLTGNEFRMQVEAIVEGFTQMSVDLTAEKRAMESIWKKRQIQIQKVLLNTNHMYSSIKGIAGNAVATIKAFELPETNDVQESKLD